MSKNKKQELSMTALGGIASGLLGNGLTGGSSYQNLRQAALSAQQQSPPDLELSESMKQQIETYSKELKEYRIQHENNLIQHEKNLAMKYVDQICQRIVNDKENIVVYKDTLLKIKDLINNTLKETTLKGEVDEWLK